MKLPTCCVALLVAAGSTHKAFAKIGHESFGKIDNFIETGSMSYNYDYAHDYDYPYAEDEEEESIMEGLFQGCPAQIGALTECYGNDVALMHCANCAYEGLKATGEDCAELPMDYEACSHVCEGACNVEVVELYECGTQMFCDDDGVRDFGGVYLKEA